MLAVQGESHELSPTVVETLLDEPLGGVGGQGVDGVPRAKYEGTASSLSSLTMATDRSIPSTVQPNGRIVKDGTRDGIDIRVVLEPPSKGGGIVTAFPTNVPRNPK